MSDSDLLARVKRIHFVGIGGAGMCALAEIMHRRGYRLTGSDVNESDTLARVRALGIPIFMGHAAANVDGAELVVHTAAVHTENVELQEAIRRGIPVMQRSELLGLITAEYSSTIAVSGTHGKTTATSMITQILLSAGLDPTALIGGKLPLIGGNCRVGGSPLMVCEACEYADTFLKLHPAISIILNIDGDHLEYFKTMENLIRHFGMFSRLTTRTLIINGDDANTLLAVKDSPLKKITFGMGASNDYTASGVTVGEKGVITFSILHCGARIADIRMRIPGRHNILNALASCAAAIEAGASAADVEKGLNAFTGAGRRFEILGNVRGVTIADDYAHHPAELRATLTAAKELGYRQVWAVFQPFTFSRTAMLMDDFVSVLKIADRVVLAEIMGSREQNTYNVYSGDLAAKLPGSIVIPDFEEIADYVMQNAVDGDLVITLGCGDIYKAAKRMLKK
ncbi:MAG: UDP-N-acetylmuramate--L-alanine ligase [Clostridia bacterium]|nr:UDP-N-acetylmuramate--L-alanine ligase [Clostridia bacterium]